MASPKDIAKVFYKLSWLEGNTKVLKELLIIMSDDYNKLSLDKEADRATRKKWQEISDQASSLADLF